jgi:hypothetical protein
MPCRSEPFSKFPFRVPGRPEAFLGFLSGPGTAWGQGQGQGRASARASARARARVRTKARAMGWSGKEIWRRFWPAWHPERRFRKVSGLPGKQRGTLEKFPACLAPGEEVQKRFRPGWHPEKKSRQGSGLPGTRRGDLEKVPACLAPGKGI